MTRAQELASKLLVPWETGTLLGTREWGAATGAAMEVLVGHGCMRVDGSRTEFGGEVAEEVRARLQWDELPPELREKLVQGEGDWDMVGDLFDNQGRTGDLFDWEESWNGEEELGWFEITELGKRTRAYGRAVMGLDKEKT